MNDVAFYPALHVLHRVAEVLEHREIRDFHFAGRTTQSDKSWNAVDDESRFLFLFRTPLERVPEHRDCVGLWSGILRHQRRPSGLAGLCVSQACALARRDRLLSARRDPDSAVAYNDDRANLAQHRTPD